MSAAMVPVPTSSRPAAVAILLVATATIGGALASQYVFGLVPCKLCLWERWPYYAGVPLALAAALAPSERTRRVALAVIALVFVAGLGLGIYHAGAEWVLWQGPSDCGGGQSGPASAADLLQSLSAIRVVSCTEAAWRFGGLSLAGWNAVVSFVIAAAAAWGALRGTVAPTSRAHSAESGGAALAGADRRA